MIAFPKDQSMFPIEIYDRVHLRYDIRTAIRLRSTCKTLFLYRFTKRYRNVAEQLEKFLIRRPAIQSYRNLSLKYAVLHLSSYITLCRLISGDGIRSVVFLWKTDLSYFQQEVQEWKTAPIYWWEAEPDLREQNRRIFGN